MAAAPKSPNLSFLPTPAVDGINSIESLSPPSHPSVIMSPESIDPASIALPASTVSGSNGSTSRFSPLTSPGYEAAPFLASPPLSRQSSIRSASRVPLSPRIKAVSANSLASAYIEQSRALLDQQRRVFEQERSLWASERALWETERRALYARIHELETSPYGARKFPESSFNLSPLEKPTPPSQPIHPGYFPNGITHNQPSRHGSGSDTGEKIWEGPSSRKSSGVTRTFAAAPDDNHLPSISEAESPATVNGPLLTMDSVLSPTGSTSSEASKVIGAGIDISLVQKGLDGISLKPSAVPPSIAAKIKSPSSASPLRSPSPSRVPPNTQTVVEEPDQAPRTPPTPPNLIADAGHTPLASRAVHETDGLATPTQTRKLPLPSVTVPVDMIISEHEVDDGDVELRGPLHLKNDDEKDKVFLRQLDSKLIEEARKIVYSPSETSSVSEIEDGDEEVAALPEPEVRLKFKRSMNFGSAFGARGVGAA